MYAVAASSAKVVAQTTRTNSAQTKRASAKPAKALKNPTVEKVRSFAFRRMMMMMMLAFVFWVVFFFCFFCLPPSF